MKKYDTPNNNNNNYFAEKLDAANVDLDSLIRLAEMVTGLTFHETRPNEYRAQHTGVRVSKPNGHRYGKLHDESMKTAFADPRGYTFKKLFFEVTNGQTFAQKVDLLYRLNVATLQECSQMQGGKAYTPNAQTIEIRAKVNAQPKPKKATNSKTWEYFTTDWNTQHGHNTMQFLQRKTGATLDVLTRYVVPISHKVGTDTDGKEYRFDSNGQNFMYGFIDKRGLVRIAQPNQPNAKRLAITGKNEAAYRYGFDQLPTDGTGKTCVICAGETDTICINAHGNQYGFYAICFNSETKPFDMDTLDELRARGFDLLALYDNDATGRKAVATHAANAGVTYVDTNLLWTYWNIPTDKKDICDLYAFGGFSTVVSALDFAKATNGQKKRDELDAFSCNIPHCYTLPFVQYLGENTDNINGQTYINPTSFIQLAMLGNRKLSVVSQAGTGKTTMLQTIFQNQDILKKYNKDFYILLVPTTSIADQQANEFRDALGVDNVVIVHGSIKPQTVLDGLDLGARVIICVYDSFPSLCGISKGKKKHISDILHRSYLVIDEYHLLVTAANYRDFDALRFIQNEVVEAANAPCLTLTGTPVLYANIQRTVTDGQTTDTHLFKHIFATPKIQSKIKCTIVTHSLKRASVGAFLEDNTPQNSKGTTLVKWDNTTYNNKLAELWNARGLNVDSINSKARENKEANDTYNGILTNGLFARHLDYLFFTKIFEVGVSIRDAVRAFYTVDTLDYRELIQLANRPRMQANGTNSEFDFFVLIRAKETDTDNQAARVLDVVQYVSTLQQEARELATLFNQSENPTDTYKLIRKQAIANRKTGTDAQIFVYPTHTPNGVIYNVDTLGILHHAQTLENAGITPQTLQNRLALDTRFEFQPFQVATEYAKDTTLEAEILTAKDVQNAHMERFDQLLTDTQTRKSVLECVAYICKNPELKEDIRDKFHLPKWSLEAHTELLETEFDALHSKGSQYKISKALDMVRAGIDKDKALQTVATSSKTDIIRDVHALVMQDRKTRLTNAKKANAKRTDGQTTTNGLNMDTVHQCERTNAAYKYGLNDFINNVKQGKIKNEFTAARVLDTANKALEKANTANGTKYKPFTTEKQALTVLTDFYNMLEPQRAWTRDGKRGKMVHSFDLTNLKRTF